MDWRHRDRFNRFRGGHEDRYGYTGAYTGRPMGYTHSSYRTGGNYRPGHEYGHDPAYGRDYGVGGYGYTRDYGYNNLGSYTPVLGDERTTWADYSPDATRTTEVEGDATTEKTRGYDDREDHTQRPYGREYTDALNMMRY